MKHDHKYTLQQMLGKYKAQEPSHMDKPMAEGLGIFSAITMEPLTLKPAPAVEVLYVQHKGLSRKPEKREFERAVKTAIFSTIADHFGLDPMTAAVWYYVNRSKEAEIKGPLSAEVMDSMWKDHKLTESTMVYCSSVAFMTASGEFNTSDVKPEQFVALGTLVDPTVLATKAKLRQDEKKAAKKGKKPAAKKQKKSKAQEEEKAPAPVASSKPKEKETPVVVPKTAAVIPTTSPKKEGDADEGFEYIPSKAQQKFLKKKKGKVAEPEPEEEDEEEPTPAPAPKVEDEPKKAAPQSPPAKKQEPEKKKEEHKKTAGKKKKGKGAPVDPALLGFYSDKPKSEEMVSDVWGTRPKENKKVNIEDLMKEEGSRKKK